MKMTSRHESDDMGRVPRGGGTSGLGYAIVWQDRPIPTSGPNGASPEGVIEAVIDRLLFFQASGFACPENEEAIAHLGNAHAALARRTERRIAEGTEGTTEKP